MTIIIGSKGKAMNSLRWLRQNAGLLMKDLSHYTGISVSVINKLETGKRKLTQKHIDILTEFYWVTSDFLLGRCDSGIYAYCSECEVITLTSDQFLKAFQHIKQNITSFKNGDGTISYKINRDLDEAYSEKHQGHMDQAIEDLNKMDETQLEKTIRFMEDYILK
jgi:transcriptional regulator with XRE-family HTH domain